ncbi:hypothetical protein BBO99_00007858 [Phytophthora kernoviae]|uniref:Uncharacterized protein n=1 Tax=Phytophthora kernoviae TaxID=325452 RepID=A0A3R7GUX4_9STRA|nr:hypothetical protein BBI17_007784 [Phytophthora kernoviae]RLN76050.1 hypothetical protein BBO99_00007858 [Phytophthora kernoviae]
MSWKKVDYKGSDSVHRLHRIQALCTNREDHLDGILIVGGIDSFHSQASQAALKYLFLGSSGQELLGEQVISHEYERLEDVILLICPQRISVFYSSESDAAVKILPVISKWRHVTEYVIHDGMEPDEQEERKISAFKSMMANVKRVGIPFGLDRDGCNLEDTMLPEKWPLIQSYGLEGGESVGKGFFTMNHQVVNISCELMKVMAQLDAFSAKRVVLESQPFLAHHFDEFLLKLDHAESPEVRSAKAETDMGEDLLSFYEFGTMQYSTRGLATAPNRGSRLRVTAEVMDARGQPIDSLNQGTRYQEEIFRSLDEWKITAAALNIPIYRTSDLSEQFNGGIPRDGDAANFDIPAPVKTACELLVYKQHFVGQDAHTIQYFFPQDFIPKDSGAATTLSKPNTEDLSKLCVPITAMLGIPGSGVQVMSQSVCKISSSSFQWVNVDVDLRDLEVSKQKQMEASGLLEISNNLTRTLDRIKSTAKSMRLHPRIMLTVIGYIDPITVACAIRRATHDTSLQSKIGAVINCVSATNVYLPDPIAAQAPFPKVFDQMTAGFVTHMVLTNSADVTSAMLQRLRFHMDHVNPFADVLVLSHEVFEGPLTPLLVVDRFETPYYKQYRNAHFRDWDSATVINSTMPSLSGYAAELDPAHAPVTFRYEIIHGMNRSNFLYLIAKTLTPYAAITKSMEKIYPLDNANTKTSKGIRIAQSIAAEKVRPSQSPSTASYAEGAFSNEASPNQVRSKASITSEEKREIQRQHAMDPLPDGYLFDGTNYVDFFGGRYEFHPSIDQFVDEYITAANDDRKATNLKATEERASHQSFVKQLS